MIKRSLVRGADVLLSGARRAHRQVLRESGIQDQLNEMLFHINHVKNGTTIQTGPYEALTRLFTGQKMYVDTRDISLAPHLMLDGHWEPEITHIFRQHITPDSVVFDIGANFGYFGLVAGTDVDHRQGGQIHFFEANPELAPYIFKTLSVNGLLRTGKIVSEAVSDRAGEIELMILDDLWGSSGIDIKSHQITNVAGRDIGVRNRVKVPMTTIDDYTKKNNIKAIDIVKMDIEGHEETAYKGMRKTVKKSPRLKMFIEFTDDAYKDSKKFFEHMLEDFGHIYIIQNDNGGTLTEVKDYATLKKIMTDTWIMLLASKKPVAA
jgi:FkbM family methyltransferase